MAERTRRGRRGNGEGALYFDKAKNLWYGRVTVDGTRRRTEGARSREEASGLLTNLLYQVSHGQTPPARQHTVAELFAQWFEQVVDRTTESPTQRQYRGAYTRYIEPAFGKRALSKVERLHVQQWANQLLDRGLSARTVRLTVTVLGMAYRQALDWNWAVVNPAAQIKLRVPKQADKRIEALEPTDVDKLLAAAAGRSMEHLLTVGLWTGMRKGELGGLRWSDIDQRRARVHVRQTLVWTNGQPWHFKDHTKNGTHRSFALLPIVARALEMQRARVARLREYAGELWTEHDLAFPSEVGTPIHPGNINHETNRLEKLAGVDHHRVHDWRHTAATMMLAAGIADRVVMEICGWKDRTMVDRYQHVQDEHLDEAAELMMARYPEAAAGSGVVQFPVRSKFAGRPHSRRKGARLETGTQ